MPRVTVVMAVYNAAQFLREAVASVLAQTYSDLELIAVDDSSSRESLSILQSFCDPGLRIIRHGTNLGAALSRNDALAAAPGELVAIMDADDVSAPLRLQRQVAFLGRIPQWAWIAGLLPGREHRPRRRGHRKPYMCFATIGAISRLRATPVFVDIDPATYNMNVSYTAAKITKKARAVVPIHLFGHVRWIQSWPWHRNMDWS